MNVFLRIRLAVAFTAVIGLTALAVLFWPRETRLPAHMERVLLARVNRFADRYAPTFSLDRRAEIASSARVASRPPIPVEAQVMAGVSCLALALLLIWISPYAWATFHRKGAWHSSKASRPFISLVVLSNLAAVVLFGFFVRQLLRADPDYKVAGGFVYDHRIFLQKEHLQRLRNDDELICALDHELTHYFGAEGLGIIRRDSWLSYAYPAVFALERGGFPMLQRETALLGTFSPIAMYAFSRGVISAEGTIPPGDAEADFIKTTLTAPINPNARSDASSEQGADANRGFDFGLAGIAWYVAAGNANIALSYLDDRSNGISAAEATGRASRKLESGDRSAARENQREFSITVVRYLLKESEHFRKALKTGKASP